MTPNTPDEYDRCAHCNRKFLARASFDNFYCDDCYLSGEYLEDDGPVPDDDPDFYDSEKQWPEYDLDDENDDMDYIDFVDED